MHTGLSIREMYCRSHVMHKKVLIICPHAAVMCYFCLVWTIMVTVTWECLVVTT